MKKIFNTILAVAAVAVIGIFTSCKPQEVYYSTAEAIDFDFGDPVVIKAETVRKVPSSTGTGMETRTSTEYYTFIPIILDAKNGGGFSYDILTDTSSSNVDVDQDGGGLVVFWALDDETDAAKVPTVNIKVIGTDWSNGENVVEKSISVTYSTNATETRTYYR